MGRPPKNKEAEETNESNLPTSQDLLGSILKETEEDHYSFIESKNKVISSGSLILDSLIKIRTGSVVRLVGKGAELGKTSECFVLADNFMKEMPKSKTLFIKAESRLSPEMQVRSGMKFVTKSENWIAGTIFVFSCNLFETVAETIEALLKEMYKQGEYLCVIIDSLDGMILKNDIQSKTLSGNIKVAGVPLLTKLMFRRLGLPINHFDALMLITGQYSASIQLDPYSKDPPRQTESSGGASIAHQSDYVLSYCPRYNGDFILEKPDEKPDYNKNKTLGVYATIEIKKSGTDVTGAKVKIPIKRGRIGNAIWKEKEVVDMIISYELIKKKGAWFTFDPEIIDKLKADKIELKETFQGINSVYEYMETNTQVFEWFYKSFKSIIS